MNYKDLVVCPEADCGWVYPGVFGKCPRCGYVIGVPISIGLDTNESIMEMQLWLSNKKDET